MIDIAHSASLAFRSSVSVRYIISNWLRSVNKSETTRSWRRHADGGQVTPGSTPGAKPAPEPGPRRKGACGLPGAVLTRCGHRQPRYQSGEGETGAWLRSQRFGTDFFCLSRASTFSRDIWGRALIKRKAPSTGSVLEVGAGWSSGPLPRPSWTTQPAGLRPPMEARRPLGVMRSNTPVATLTRPGPLSSHSVLFSRSCLMLPDWTLRGNENPGSADEPGARCKAT